MGPWFGILKTITKFIWSFLVRMPYPKDTMTFYNQHFVLNEHQTKKWSLCLKSFAKAIPVVTLTALHFLCNLQMSTIS
jgi:hypothetical protein